MKRDNGKGEGRMERWGVVGGDLRQVYLARALQREGLAVILHGLDQLEEAGEFPTGSLQELGQQCDAVVLPVPVTRDGLVLNTPFASQPIPLDENFARALSGPPVLGGMVEKLRASCPLWEALPLLDYAKREDFALGNGFLTAEGAIALAVEGWPGSLCGSRCLVTGFGRIGKALCLALRGLGARVECTARKPQDLTAIQAMGLTPTGYSALTGPWDVIFNTVPAPVLGRSVLSTLEQDCLLVELASAPGGIDRQAAEDLGLQVVNAPGLPGRFSPKAAGELIQKSVAHMLEERRNR